MIFVNIFQMLLFNFQINVKNDVAGHGYKNELFIDDRGEGRSMKFVKCTQSDLEDALKTIKSNSAGIDGLSLKAFKAVAAYLLPCLLYLVNLSMEKGQFPDALKQAKLYLYIKVVTKEKCQTGDLYRFCHCSQKYLKRLFIRNYIPTLILLGFYVTRNLDSENLILLVMQCTTFLMF